MSQTADTVTNILQIVSDLRGETSTNTDAVRIRAVSRAEQDIAGRMFFGVHLLKDQTATGDGSTTTFTLGSTTYPMRPNGLSQLYVGGTTSDAYRYDIVDFYTFRARVNSDASAQVAYVYYDQATDAWKMTINPTPSSGTTITYSYYFFPPKRTSTSDTVICPNTLAVAKLALGYIYESEDELQKMQLVKQEAEQMIAELLGLEKTPHVGGLTQMSVSENGGQPSGFGTY